MGSRKTETIIQDIHFILLPQQVTPCAGNLHTDARYGFTQVAQNRSRGLHDDKISQPELFYPAVPPDIQPASDQPARPAPGNGCRRG